MELPKEKLVEWVYSNSMKISRATAELIVDEVVKYDHPLFILSLIAVESEFNPTALSTAKARGLTQVRWEVHKDALKKLGLKEGRDLFNIKESILAGDMLFRDMLKRSGGDPEKALILYLGGRDGKYVARIFNHLARLYMDAGGTK
jgi:soluble lytic murein transglycosylase-like protein